MFVSFLQFSFQVLTSVKEQINEVKQNQKAPTEIFLFWQYNINVLSTFYSQSVIVSSAVQFISKLAGNIGDKN